METAYKPAEQGRIEQPNPAGIDAGKQARLFNLCLLIALLAGWFVFVQALEGLDLDTTFLAVFCAALSMFVIKSIIAGLIRQD